MQIRMNSDDRLIAAFEAGEIDNTEFPHEAHVRVTWSLVQRYAREEALERLITGIRGIARRAGRPDAYHETITRAWFQLVAGAEDIERHPELFDKGLLSRYYSTTRLSAGRSVWLEPDLHPLNLPAPAAAPPALPAVLCRIPAAVAVLASRADHTVRATTVSSVTSVSRDPALVSVCLANGSRTLKLLQSARAFTLSVLASDQDWLAVHFADTNRPADAAQFANIAHRGSPFGPILDDTAAWIGCSVHAMYTCGDHSIVVGQVELAEVGDRPPLVRHDGLYH
jgi:flavin reductase (DIM6/NTAB) family NADH-FMN oxidoreductase RutF